MTRALQVAVPGAFKVKRNLLFRCNIYCVSAVSQEIVACPFLTEGAHNKSTRSGWSTIYYYFLYLEYAAVDKSMNFNYIDRQSFLEYRSRALLI